MYSIPAIIIAILFIITLPIHAVGSCVWQYIDGWQLRDAPDARPVGFYVDSLFELNYDFAGSRHVHYNSTGNFSQVTADSISIGIWAGHDVLELRYKISDNYYEKGRAILVETSPGLYKILHLYLGIMMQYDPNPAQIINIDSISVLFTKSRIDGNSTQYSEAYWIWDYDCNVPIELGWRSIAEKAEKGIVPDEYRAQNRFFDIQTLTSGNYIEKPGDHYRWPTGGKITIKYRLENSGLVADSIHYDSTDIPGH